MVTGRGTFPSTCLLWRWVPYNQPTPVQALAKATPGHSHGGDPQPGPVTRPPRPPPAPRTPSPDRCRQALTILGRS